MQSWQQDKTLFFLNVRLSVIEIPVFTGYIYIFFLIRNEIVYQEIFFARNLNDIVRFAGKYECIVHAYLLY